MKLSLFKIEQEYVVLMDQLLENGGEVTPEISEQLKINEQNLTTKGTNFGFVIKELEGEVDLIDSEIKRLSALKSSRNKAVDRLKEMLSTAMKLYEIEEIKSPVMKISFRKSESVFIEDENLLDRKFIVSKTTETPDKAAIKEAIKSGESVVGAVIKENKNIQIK